MPLHVQTPPSDLNHGLSLDLLGSSYQLGRNSVPPRDWHVGPFSPLLFGDREQQIYTHRPKIVFVQDAMGQVPRDGLSTDADSDTLWPLCLASVEACCVGERPLYRRQCPRGQRHGATTSEVFVVELTMPCLRKPLLVVAMHTYSYPKGSPKRVPDPDRSINQRPARSNKNTSSNKPQPREVHHTYPQYASRYRSPQPRRPAKDCELDQQRL